MPRNAWVIQITPVRLTRTTANDASVVRKIYLSIDPITPVWSPPHSRTRGPQPPEFSGSPRVAPRTSSRPSPHSTIPLIRQQNGRGKAPPFLRLINHLTWPACHGGLASWRLAGHSAGHAFRGPPSAAQAGISGFPFGGLFDPATSPDLEDSPYVRGRKGRFRPVVHSPARRSGRLQRRFAQV